ALREPRTRDYIPTHGRERQTGSLSRHHVTSLRARIERRPGEADLRAARLAVSQRALDQRAPQASALVVRKHEEHGEVPQPAPDEGRDHATDPPVFDGTEVAVGVARQCRSGIARYRRIIRPGHRL